MYDLITIIFIVITASMIKDYLFILFLSHFLDMYIINLEGADNGLVYLHARNKPSSEQNTISNEL